MKKGNFKIICKVFWILFLFSYFVFLLYHAIHEISICLFLGIVVAIFAHAKKNLVSLFLLIGHMSIEWFEWGTQTLVFGLILLNLIHAVMDFIFLNHEIRVHIKKINSYLSLLIVLSILIVVYKLSPEIKINEEIIESLHRFVLGGVMGCVGSHIIFHFTKEKTETKKQSI